MGANDAIQLVQMFASTWLSLEAYDNSSLPKSGVTKKQVNLTSAQLANAILDLKNELILSQQATSIFASERQVDSIESIIGNVFQTTLGVDVYPTIEEKAANILYFFVKNHPFVDGNKRSGAFAFIWFLSETGILNKKQMSPDALTALTLFVAISDPHEKDKIIGLILQLLKK